MVALGCQSLFNKLLIIDHNSNSLASFHNFIWIVLRKQAPTGRARIVSSQNEGCLQPRKYSGFTEVYVPSIGEISAPDAMGRPHLWSIITAAENQTGQRTAVLHNITLIQQDAQTFFPSKGKLTICLNMLSYSCIMLRCIAHRLLIAETQIC